MKMTVAGDIRRIRRNILKPNGNGMVIADYGELHKVFADIETKEREYKSLIKELADALDVSCDCHLPCDGCKMADESKFDCPDKAYRALVARAREVCK